MHATRSVFCVDPVGFSVLRLTGRENTTKENQSGWRSDFVVPVENNFLEANCHQFPGLCCCHPLQFEDHDCVLHQDVEDHLEEEDEVGSSRSFALYSS